MQLDAVRTDLHIDRVGSRHQAIVIARRHLPLHDGRP